MLRTCPFACPGCTTGLCIAKSAAVAVSNNFDKTCSTTPLLSKNLLFFDSIIEFQGYFGGYAHSCIISIGQWMAATAYSHLGTFYTTDQYGLGCLTPTDVDRQSQAYLNTER